jgi:ABC-type multidrug transport system ATPase subunit
VRDEVIAQSLARGETPSAAKALAEAALERAGARHCAQIRPRELDTAEAMRATIAQALASQPALLIIDEPTKGVNLLDRDGILSLLRSLAREGIAVLTSVGESTGLFGADRALSLSEGEMHGSVSPALAPVVRLPQRAIA